MSKMIYIFIGVSLLLLCGCENLGPEEPMALYLSGLAVLAAIQGMARAILSTNSLGLEIMI